MRKRLIVLDIILIIILSYLGYKSFNLNNYKIDNPTINIGNDITITYNKKVTKEIQGNLNFNLSEEYEIDDTSTTYYLEDDKYITFSEVPDIIKTICRYDQRLLSVDYVDIMSKNGMSNEIDILQYSNVHKNDQLNIVSPLKTIKTNYFATTFIKSLNINGEVNILKGLDGFKYNNTIYLFNKGNLYKVVFTDNYEETEIISILNTFRFD